MAGRIGDARNLRDVLIVRGLTMEALAVISRSDTATISKIVTGKARATPQTVVRLARGLGISATRMQKLCDASWRDLEHPGQRGSERLRQVDLTALAEAEGVPIR
jgi:plasmid maintenance system antidote protein VapI